MKEMYTKPVVQVEEFNTTDVVTTSGIDKVGALDD
jgi:hypothetical protein